MLRTFSLVFAGVVALTVAGYAKADDDTVRLDGKGDAEVTEARYGYGGGYHGGGYRGGYYGGYRGGYYGGWGRGYYGSWGRGYYGGWGRGYYGIGIGYGGYGGYYGSYYGGGYYPSYYYSSPYYAAPCTCSAGTADFGVAVTSAPRFVGDSTFAYNGGPQDAFAPAMQPAGTVRPAQPRNGLLVSVPASESGYRFPAFGEQPGEPTSRPTPNSTLRVSYPAYGESAPTGFSAGTTNYNVVFVR